MNRLDQLELEHGPIVSLLGIMAVVGVSSGVVFAIVHLFACYGGLP